MSNCNENYIREAAYYLWQNAGCPNGQDEKFWSMAIEQFANCSCSKSTAKKSCCKKSCASSSTSAKKSTATKSTKASSKK